ncbi:pseudouridine synthase [Hominifimenecus sp. rT4P-3]|uniref:pseudouridine synthase n=1 Tax=Hominifimenecus sp. rT4P-3 TaxID=3242979 RepID=UPI003DA3D9DF
MEATRLNKYLSAAGVCSRREADRWIEEGRVFVDGKPAEPGQKVMDTSEVTVDGRRIEKRQEEVILAVYKPQGIVCTTAEHRGEKNIVDLVRYPERIYPVGRLDKASEGLILMTNIGAITDQILRGSNYHEKEYQVRINRPVTLEFLQQMRSGVPILDTVTRPCQVKKTGPDSFRIILTQGLNRQIRRMCEALGCRVVELKRLRVMNITLGDLKPGEYRKIEGPEKDELFALLSGRRQEDKKQTLGYRQ